MATCRACGLELGENYAFCPYCGRGREQAEMTVGALPAASEATGAADSAPAAVGGAAWERNVVNAPTIGMPHGMRPPRAMPLQPPGMGTSNAPAPGVLGVPGTPFANNAVVTGITSVKPVQQKIAFSIESFVGAMAGIGVAVGARLNWLKPTNAFRLPAWWLVDVHTKSDNPKLGWIIVVLGALGVVSSIVRLRKLRVLIGFLTIAASSAFLIQVFRTLNNAKLKPSFTDVVGLGPFVALGAGVLLLLSPLFGRPRADK